MKKHQKTLYVVLAILLTLASAFTFVQRRYLFNANVTADFQVNWIWGSYNQEYVVIEYDLEGSLETPDGELDVCPTGDGNLVIDADGKTLKAEVYTVCRPVSDARYSVTQIFYGGQEDNHPQKVKVNIGGLTYFSPKESKEVYVPVVQSFVFDLPASPSIDGIFTPTGRVQGARGVDLAVTKAIFTPRAAKIDICLALPDNGDWGMDAYVVMDGQITSIDYWEIPNFREPQTFSTNKRCYATFTSNLADFRNLRDGGISFVIDNLHRNLPDCVDEKDFLIIKDELEKYGVESKPVDAAGSYCFLNDIVNQARPEDNGYLVGYIKDVLKDEVPGPFEIDIK